jgi:hypothetical protein
MQVRHALTSSMLVVVGLWSLGWLPPSTSAALAATNATTLSSQSGFGLHSLLGDYGFTYSGSSQGVGLVASCGRINFDGAGHVSAVFTTSVNGAAFRGNFTGSYLVQDDGTGSVVLNLPWLGLQARGNFVIVDNGDGTFFTSTDAGYSITGTTRRM